MRFLVLLALGLTTGPRLSAQSHRLVVQPTTSLAWWQIDPHYEHLWATTCPNDLSWQPGEGRDPGQYTDYATRPSTIAAARSDARIPLFPRYRVRPVCRQAVQGQITVEDTTTLRGVRGRITLIADSLFTGLAIRDAYARRAVIQTGRYPLITFEIDSLVQVTRGATIRGTVVGTFELHGVTIPVRAPLTATREPAGLRVQAQFSVPASALTEVFQMPNWALGMGVGMRRWKTVHMGVDVVLVNTP